MDTVTKSFDYAFDLGKQLITLASVLNGVSLTLTTAFEDKLTHIVTVAWWFLGISWVLLTISIVAGALCLMAITGVVAEEAKKDNSTGPNLFSHNIVLLSKSQIITFALGLIVFVCFGFSVMYSILR